MILLLLSLTPEALLEKIDQSLKPPAYSAVIIMKNHLSERNTVDYKFLIKSQKDRGTIIEVLSPAREAGRKMLLIERNIWLYAPEINRTIRLSLRDRFFGSEFTNGDLLASQYRDNYRAVSLDSTGKFYHLVLLAKDKKAPYSRIEMDVRKDILVPVSMNLYALSGRLLRRMEMKDIRMFDGYHIATYMVVKNQITPEKYTEVWVEKFQPRKGFPEGTFRPWRLE